MNAAAKLSVSIPYVIPSPGPAISRPATSGPTVVARVMPA